MKYVGMFLVCAGLITVMGAVGNDDFHNIELVKAGMYVAEEAPSFLQTLLLSLAGLMSMGFGALILKEEI